MAGVEEIMTALQTAMDELNDCISATTNAEAEAGETVSQLAALGMPDAAQALAAAKDAIEKARVHLAGGSDLLEDAVSAVRAASG